MGKMGRISYVLAKWLVTVAIAAAMLLVAGLLLTPRVLGWQGGIVLTGSMEPALKTGSLAFVQPVGDASSVKVGDIVTFVLPSDPGEEISHRVVEVVNGSQGLEFRTKGDANQSADTELVPAADVHGKVRLSVPYLGSLAGKLRHSQNYYLAVGIAAVFLLILEAVAKGMRRQRREAAT